MFRRRALLTAAIGLALVATALDASPGVRFASPLEGDLVVGLTEFRFEVSDPALVERIDVYVNRRLVGSATPPEWRFSWEAPGGLVGVPVTALVFAGGTVVEKVQIMTSELDFDDVLDVLAVELFPVVVDRKGRYIDGLLKEDFEIFDQGSKVEIEMFTNDEVPLTLVILIDTSGSMRDKISVVQAASSQFIGQLRPSDDLAVYSFNQSIVRAADFSHDRMQAKKMVRRLQPVGGTALYDAIVHTLRDLEPIKGRKAIVLFSDGRDELSMTSLSRTVELARRSEVMIYTVGAGRSNADRAARDDLRLLADETGGQAHIIEKLKTLPATYAAILSNLRAQYSLSYSPQPAAAGHRQLEVRVTNAKYEVNCRKSYYHPGSEKP